MEGFCTFKIKIKSWNLDHWYIKCQWPYRHKDQDARPQSGTSRILKALNKDLKDMDDLCTFKIKIESQKSEYGCTKDHLSYPNQDEDARPQSGTSRVLHSPKSGLLNLQNQGREPKFGAWLYQRPVIISKSTSRCQTPVTNLQYPPKPQIRT